MGYPFHPREYYEDDCPCAKTGEYQPECEHCEPEGEDEQYMHAFYQQEIKGK